MRGARREPACDTGVLLRSRELPRHGPVLGSTDTFGGEEGPAPLCHGTTSSALGLSCRARRRLRELLFLQKLILGPALPGRRCFCCWRSGQNQTQGSRSCREEPPGAQPPLPHSQALCRTRQYTVSQGAAAPNCCCRRSWSQLCHPSAPSSSPHFDTPTPLELRQQLIQITTE